MRCVFFLDKLYYLYILNDAAKKRKQKKEKKKKKKKDMGVFFKYFIISSMHS